ncbi:MAG: glycosyltransferase [Clostridia bacterium]|nr:glycosyltransferase [Clostridia bacterium]
MKKVTLIVPVYNSEKFIGKCIDSILNQTYSNYEIMIVNDGSNDKSQEIINDYKKKYPNKIIAIEQDNKGVAITRNESIKKANRQYIMFIDNDDYIDKNYIETFINEIEENDYDVVIGGYRRINDNQKILKQMKLVDKQWNKFLIMAPWAKIYKKEFLIKNNIEFLNVNLGEDVYFNLKALLASDKIKIIDYIGYNWFYNTTSVSNSKQKDIRNLQVYELLNSCYKMLKESELLDKNYDLIKTYFTRYAVWLLTFSTKKLPYKIISEEYDKLFNWLEEKFPDYKKNKMIGFLKPDGDILSVRIVTKMFMILNKMKLGKIALWFYSKI